MRPIEILLVEDNPGDVRLTKEALRGAKMDSNMIVARDGEEAMEYLSRAIEVKADEGEARSRPDLVLLDLNLPRKNGHEVLRWIKSRDALRSIPVVILTTSSAESDISACYDNHANCYLTKPVDFSGFVSVISDMMDFWFQVVRLPTRQDAYQS